MISAALADPIEHPLDEALVDWLLDPGALDREEPVAEHLFACGRCCARVEDLRVVVAGLAELQRHRHEPIQTRASVAALEARGDRVQHIFGRHGEEVVGAISREVDILVMHLPVPATASSLTVRLCEPDGRVFFTIEDARADGGEVILACHRFIAQGNPALRVKVSEARGTVVCDALFVQGPG
jgi:hypothetical protein